MFHRTAFAITTLIAATAHAQTLDAVEAKRAWTTHCLGCHNASATAPLQLDSCERIVRHRVLARMLISDGTMPPWLPDATSAPLLHDRTLDRATRTVLLDALATRESALRAFEGLIAAAPMERELDERASFAPLHPWTVPATGGMRIRSFLAENPANAPTRVRGVRVSDPASMAQSPMRFLSLVADPARTLARLEEFDPREEHAHQHTGGFESMAGVGRTPSGALGALSRVSPTFELPRGFAFDLPRGAVAIETLSESVGRRAHIQPRLTWIAADDHDTRTISARLYFAHRLVLEPDEISTRMVGDIVTRDIDVVAIIVKGGAFLRSVAVTSTDASLCSTTLLTIRDWRMAFAEPWILTQPMRVSAGSALDVRFGFDNSAHNPQQPARPPRRVIQGLPPDDEDASVVLLVADVAALDEGNAGAMSITSPTNSLGAGALPSRVNRGTPASSE